LDAAELDPNARRMSEISDLLRRVANDLKRQNVSPEEANNAALRLAEKNPDFLKLVIREWATKIAETTGKSCSPKIVGQTALWIKTMQHTGRGRSKGSKPKVVSMTPALEAILGDKEPQGTLEKLIAEQEADDEPSPLEPDSPDYQERKRRKVRERKRL
jgi:hypothetical protein